MRQKKNKKKSLFRWISLVTSVLTMSKYFRKISFHPSRLSCTDTSQEKNYIIENLFNSKVLADNKSVLSTEESSLKLVKNV